MKTYYVTFGSGDPRPNFGLAPTFVIFNNSGSAVTAPSIAAVAGATGFYSFTYGATTPIAFLIDGFTTGLGAYRYVQGSIDPADRSDEYGNTIISLENLNLQQGQTILASIGTGGTLLAFFGTPGSTFGGQTTDPVDMFGYLKRFQELLEGDNDYFKASGLFQLFSRGSSTLLRAKTIANSVSTVIKSGS